MSQLNQVDTTRQEAPSHDLKTKSLPSHSVSQALLPLGPAARSIEASLILHDLVEAALDIEVAGSVEQLRTHVPFPHDGCPDHDFRTRHEAVGSAEADEPVEDPKS